MLRLRVFGVLAGLAMITVGIRELKRRAGELVRLVMQTGADVQIMDDGSVVARLISVERVRKHQRANWVTLDHLAAEIEKGRNVREGDRD